MKLNERGFMLLSAVFLTVILSFAAMMTLQATTQVKNESAALRLHAINLANQQFAMVESYAAQNNLSSVKNFNGNLDDLKSYGLYSDKNKKLTEFEVKTTISGAGNLKEIEVIVNWQGNSEPLKFTKIVRVVKNETE